MEWYESVNADAKVAYLLTLTDKIMDKIETYDWYYIAKKANEKVVCITRGFWTCGICEKDKQCVIIHDDMIYTVCFEKRYGKPP